MDKEKKSLLPRPEISGKQADQIIIGSLCLLAMLLAAASLAENLI